MIRKKPYRSYNLDEDIKRFEVKNGKVRYTKKLKIKVPNWLR